MNCPKCALPLDDLRKPCPRCAQRDAEAALDVDAVPVPQSPRRRVPPSVAVIGITVLGLIVAGSFVQGGTTAPITRISRTPTPSTLEGVTTDALRAYATKVFGNPANKTGVVAWFTTVEEFAVEGKYAVARTTLTDTPKDIRTAVDVCVALAYFVNNGDQEGVKLTSVRVYGKQNLMLIDTLAADPGNMDPCQSFRARPTRTRD